MICRRKDLFTEAPGDGVATNSQMSIRAGGSKRTLILVSLVLLVVTLALYWQVVDHEFINLDDDVYVTDNLQVARGLTLANVVWAFTATDIMYWHPLTLLSHMADVQFFGMNPHYHHFTNLLMHAFAAVLLFLLLYRMTASIWQGAFVAFLFALHPLHVESVAWVAERKDVLSAFFCFLTLFLYAVYLDNRKPLFYLLTFFMFLLGLMSKPMLVTLPLVMLLLDFWPLNRFVASVARGDGNGLTAALPQLYCCLREKIPFFVCSLFLGIITVYGQHKIGAMPDVDLLPLGHRIDNAIVSYLRYIGKTLWPVDLAVLYPPLKSIPLWQVSCSFLVLLIISWAVIRVGRNHPCLPVGWFWFLVTLLPVIGLAQAGSQSMADRFTYIPHIGLFIMVAWTVPVLVERIRFRKVALSFLAGAVLISSAALTWHQLGYWQDNVSLYRHALSVTSNNCILHNNLGIALFARGEVEAAIREYGRTLAINPNYADAHYNLGLALAGKGEEEAAVLEYQRAIRINPQYANAHYNLGVAFAGRGDLDKAILEYRAALELNPNFADAHNNLGVAFDERGDLQAAISEYRAALAINPKCADAHNNLGTALCTQGNLSGAMREYLAALAINPNYFKAVCNLGNLFAMKGDLDAAIWKFKEALAINPGYDEADKNLKLALALKSGQ